MAVTSTSVITTESAFFAALCKLEKQVHPADTVAGGKKRVWGSRGRRRRNRPGSHFEEMGFKGGSSAASWMLGITKSTFTLVYSR